MHTSDLTQVVQIERNTQVMPWSRLGFEESLTKQYVCRVVVKLEQIVAFHISCPIADEMHIMTLAVAHTSQGKGIGHMLMHDIMALAEQNAAAKVFLEVRASNVAAQQLYLKWQFKQIAMRKAYYQTPDQQREDALIMVRTVT